jgi:hypothetical protein
VCAVCSSERSSGRRRGAPGRAGESFSARKPLASSPADFLTVETALLRRYYVLFLIAHASRRVWLAGCTQNPTGA